MRHLWYCEMKKLISNKDFVLVFLFFTVLAMGVQMLRPYLPLQNKVTTKELSLCYEEYEGEDSKVSEGQISDRLARLERRADVEKLSVLTGSIREVLLENLMQKWNLTEVQLMQLEEPLLYCNNTEDEILLQKVIYHYIVQINHYSDYIQEVCERSESIQESTLYKEDTYSLQVAENTSQTYEKLQGLQLDAINPVGIEVATGNWVDDVVRFLFCCMSCMFLFQIDKENGLSTLFFSTQNGCRRLYWCKVCVALICNVLFCIITLCVQMGAGTILSGLAEFSQPIQTIPAYYKCPYKLTIGDFIYLNGILKVWNVVVQTLVVSIFYITFEFVVAWAGIVLGFILSIVFYIGVPESSVLRLIKYMNLASFSQTENILGDLIFIKMGNIPISYQSGMFIVTIGLVVIALRIGKCNFKYRLSEKRTRLKLRKKEKRRTSSLLLLETKKIIRPQIGLFILCISMVAQVVLYSAMCSGIGFEEQLLENRLRQIEGKYSKEIHETILQEMTEVQNGQRIYSDAQINCLDQLLTISQYLENVKSDTEAYYVYSGGYEALVGIRKVSIEYQDISITISLSLLLVGIFVQEKRDGMCFLNETTLHRKKIYQKKILLVILVSIFACIFWWLPEYVYIFQNFYVANPFATVASVPAFSEYPSGMLLWQIVVIVWLMRMLRCVVTGLLIAFASYKAKNYIMAWFLSMVLLLGQWGVTSFLQEIIK